MEVFFLGPLGLLASLRYPNTTRTIFPNGEVDPWHWESVLEHPNPEIDTIFIKGASHCEWMPLGLRV